MTVDELLRRTPLHHDWTATVLRRARWLVLASALLVVFAELMRPTRSTWLDLLVYLAMPTWLLSGLLPAAWPPNPDAERDGSGFLVRYGRGWRYGLRAFFIVPSVGIGILVIPKASAEPVAAVVALCIVAAVVALAILVTRETLRVTTSGVRRTSPWTGRITNLQWQDVTRCDVDGWPRLVLAGSRAKLTVPLAFEGSSDFATQVLSSLPAPVLDAGANVRPVLEAVAARVAARKPASEARATSLRSGVAPAAAMVALLAAGLATWSYSVALETPLRVPIPPGWVDLSPGVPDRNFDGFPPSLRERASQHGVVTLAAERAADPGTITGQVLVVEIHNGELEVDSVARELGTNLAKAIPGAHVESQRAEFIAGVRVVRAEVSLSDGAVVMYAVPVIARTATVAFTCAVVECDRVRKVAAATLGETRGLAEPTFPVRYTAPLVRSGAMLAIFVALWLGIVGLQVSLRRRQPATGAGASAAAVSTLLVDVAEEPGALRRTALIVWGALLGGSVLFLGVAVLLRPRLTSSNPSRALALMLAALSLAAAVASFFIPRLVRGGPRSTPGSTALTRLTARAAACEASVLLGAFGYLVNGEPIALACAGAGVLAFLAAFPRELDLVRGREPAD